MKISEMFEGENSSLRKTFNECVRKDMKCPSCQFEKGHSPECEKANAQQVITDLIEGVVTDKYGTKNKVELIMKLYQIKDLL